MAQLQLPEGMSIIARTAGIGRSAEELQWDLNYLMQLWRAIEAASQSGHSGQPMLIYLESSLVIRAIRDYFQPDIGEILIDTTEIHDQARAFMDIVMPDNVGKVKRYHDDVPLFSAFPDRAPDRNRVLADSAAAVRRRDCDRPHRSARRGRRELGARHQGRGHRGNGRTHEPRSRRRSCPPAASARSGRPDRDRFHRHGIGQKPARG